jgi:hypothetical protein
MILDPIKGTYSDQGITETVEGRLSLSLEVPDGELALKVSRR